jgi:perosamine synthetase
VIPLFRPTVHADEEIEAVSRVIRSGWWAQGPETEAFEDEFARYVGARHAVALSSCTAALELAARATGLVNGVVVVPALTFFSTALAMHHAGNKVRFADIDGANLTLDWDSVNHVLRSCEKISGPRGVVPVWYGGQVDDMRGVVLPDCTRVIEDCAHAAGSSMAGKVGRAACWSFHAVKNLATGDGGMVTTDDDHVAREVRRMRWVGIDKTTWDRDKDAKVGYGWDYDIRALDGVKAHMNDITAAIGRVQLRHLDKDNARRRAIARLYREFLQNIPGFYSWLTLPAVSEDSATHMYAIRVKAEHRDRFIQHMIGQGVSAGVHYKPLTHYRDRHDRPLFGHEQIRLPVTEAVWETLVTLPLFPSMTDTDIEAVIKAVRSFPV